jgi:class 3 adenylate cyclase
MRQIAAEKVAAAIKRRDPALLDELIERGVVRQEWLDHPGAGPISDATPLEALERALAGLVERHPSSLSSVGLSAVELLSAATTGTDSSEVRSTVTVAFTDLEGFTRYTARQGDVAAASLLTDHYRGAGRVVRSRGGRVVKHLGDGILMTFAAPTGAVLAALELVEHGPRPLRVRAGLHVGDVLVEGQDVVGHVVNVAARVTESAKGGEVLISRELRDALPVDDIPQLAIGRPRLRSLKGFDERIAVCTVTRP